MAKNDPSETFFYADEDVFIGKKRSQREIIKSTIMGQNYESPVAKSSSASTSNLPDVITVLSDKNSTSHKNNVEGNTTHHINDEVVIIDLDCQSDSIQIISDDDEQVENIVENGGTLKENATDWKPNSTSNDYFEESDDVVKEGADKAMTVAAGEYENKENIMQAEACGLEDWKALLDVIPEREASSKESEIVGIADLSINALIEASRQLGAYSTDPMVEDSKPGMVKKPSLDGSTFSNFDFSLLAGVSESVLDISHGSSLPSPAAERKDSSLGLLATAVYEDISCDGDHMFDTLQELPKAEIDLHMSVDETDHIAQGSDQYIRSGSDVTQPTFYKSCLSEVSNSVYTTANNTVELSTSKPPSSLFSDYRDTFSDSVLAEETNVANFIDVDNDNKNETSFEIVMNNRQSSFTNNTVKTEDTTETKKPLLSKLPVFNCPSNILKPSSLPANIDSKLKARNYKWAKTLPKPYQIEKKHNTFQVQTSMKKSTEKDSEQEKKTLAKPAIQKPTLIKTPAKCVLGQPTFNKSKTPNKPLANQLIPKNPSYKTPDQKTPSSKLPESVGKTPKGVKTPLSSGKRSENKNLLVDKERYKNVLSPVRAYINNAPITMQRKVNVPEEEVILMGSSTKKEKSHIPKLVNTPGTSKHITGIAHSAKSSKVAQKLVYSKDQENKDPNYSRDTLPPRMFQAAAAVFMKEPEPPKRHLPKMGESMQKLVDTPRPKVIVHQGRVKESPKSKGKLIPTINIIPNTPETPAQREAADTRISVRVVKTAENSAN